MDERPALKDVERSKRVNAGTINTAYLPLLSTPIDVQLFNGIPFAFVPSP
jgi:hypothetical protein